MNEQLLYIHGFNSSPGSKFEELKLEFSEPRPFTKFSADIHSIQLDLNSPKKNLEQLRDIVENKGITILVGSSLGAFYSILLAEEFPHLMCYLINPSIDPFRSLSKHVGQIFSNYVSGDIAKFTQEALDEIGEMKIKFDPLVFRNINFYIGTEDDVINHSILLNKLTDMKIPTNIKYSTQDHSHSDIKNVIHDLQSYIYMNNLD